MGSHSLYQLCPSHAALSIDGQCFWINSFYFFKLVAIDYFDKRVQSQSKFWHLMHLFWDFLYLLQTILLRATEWQWTGDTDRRYAFKVARCKQLAFSYKTEIIKGRHVVIQTGNQTSGHKKLVAVCKVLPCSNRKFHLNPFIVIYNFKAMCPWLVGRLNACMRLSNTFSSVW